MGGATVDIRYVCLSDLHLGEQHGLLTGVDREGNVDPLVGSVAVLEKLVLCFQELFGAQQTKPTLILLGDALELALTTDNVACMAFERFVHLTLVEGRLFDRIVYVPGNHDHHLWESARETQYVDKYLGGVAKAGVNAGGGNDSPLGIQLKAAWHTTSMFILEKPERQTDLYLLSALVHRFPELEESRVLAAYPHLGLRTPNGRRAVVLHHGHFLEELYHLMSTLRGLMFGKATVDETLEEIEATNFAWIDFFWSTMGRSGSLGPKIDLLYTIMAQRPNQLRDYVDNLASGLAERLKFIDLPGHVLDFLGEPVEKKILELLLDQLFARAGSSQLRIAGEACGDTLRESIRRHLAGPVAAAMLDECVEHSAPGYTARFPEELAFVIGHTHKPFVRRERVAFPGAAGVPPREQTVDVYNLGGWVADTVTADPLHGAAALLLDDDLQPAYLHLYQEEGLPRVTVGPSPAGVPPQTGLSQQVDAVLAAQPQAWTDFSATVVAVRAQRAGNLKRQLDAAHDEAVKPLG
jgi:hypothetical protein